VAIAPLLERCEPRPVELAAVRADRVCLSDKLIENGREMLILVATVTGDLVTLAVMDGNHVARRTFTRAAMLDVSRPC
jgi:hypothetical protein